MITIKLLVIDCDYTFNRINQPVIRLFGKNVNDGEDVILHVTGFKPYIYLGDCGMDIFELKKIVEEKFRSYIEEVQIVKKFKSIGYQIEKSNFLRLVLYSPKVVRDLRVMLKESIEEITDASFYEADIKFNNRYMIDYGIDGMSVVEFNDNGNELDNYGLNCSKLYIVSKDSVKVLNENIMIEY